MHQRMAESLCNNMANIAKTWFTNDWKTIGNVFVHHLSNTCYTTYTNKTLLNRIIPVDLKDEIEDEKLSLSMQTRQNQSTIRDAPNPERSTIRHQKCIICDQISRLKIYEKFRICEFQMANKFLCATQYLKIRYFQGHVI